jgi:hypothetical protein
LSATRIDVIVDLPFSFKVKTDGCEPPALNHDVLVLPSTPLLAGYCELYVVLADALAGGRSFEGGATDGDGVSDGDGITEGDADGMDPLGDGDALSVC